MSVSLVEHCDLHLTDRYLESPFIFLIHILILVIIISTVYWITAMINNYSNYRRVMNRNVVDEFMVGEGMNENETKHTFCWCKREGRNGCECYEKGRNE